ncbi:MAG: YraN family protein [Eggerthellaceae bacterium]|nr:YraN family protein [Eggerthellaceae bacterium]
MYEETDEITVNDESQLLESMKDIPLDFSEEDSCEDNTFQKMLDEKDPEMLKRFGCSIAIHFIDKLGYELIEKNYTTSSGKIDLIAEDDDTLVFIDVHVDCGDECDLPEESFGRKTRLNFENVALNFLKEYEGDCWRLRLDTIGIAVVSSTRAFLRHHVNVFRSPCV